MLKCSSSYDTLEQLTAGMSRLVSTGWIKILRVANRFDPLCTDRGHLPYPDVHLLVHLEGVTHGYVVEVQLRLKQVTDDVMPRQIFEFLKANNPMWHTDVHAPAHVVVRGSKAMQTVLAKKEL